ncbi:MAG TPA: hypothetical protein PLO62_05630 [Candidatus Hydrogenedentes bacterium]|nr:hypothetical protein [Candidatus Hydrogenedentota bacterium]HOS01519.1 hypothetical protein [Candidatus Hydrogenedentota bacterium]
MTFTQKHDRAPETSRSSVDEVRRVLFGVTIATVAALTALGGVAYWRGGDAVAHMAAIEPAAVLQQGLDYEDQGRTDNAIDCYRRSFALGLNWPPSREDAMRRLSRLLRERGGIRGYREGGAHSIARNGGFESDANALEGWTCDAHAVVVDPLEKIEGRHALRWTLDASQSDALSQEFRVLPGVRYRVSFWTRCLDAPPAGMGFVVEPRQGGLPLALGKPMAGTEEWKQQAVEFVAPEGTRDVRMAFRAAFREGEPRTGTLWVDDVVVDCAADSLLRNGSFDRDPAWMYWADPQQGVTATPDESDCVEGHRSLKVTLPASMDFYAPQTVSVTPGKAYRLTGWVKTEQVGGAGARLEVADAVHGWQSFLRFSEGVTGTREWTPLVLDFDVPMHVTRVNVSLRRPAGPEPDSSSTSCVIWFDAYTLEARRPA